VVYLCNLVNPERVNVGNDLSLAGEVVLQPLREVVRRSAIRSAAEQAGALALRDSDGFVSSRLRLAAGYADDSRQPDRCGQRPRPARPREDQVPRRR
jgi:hypothetical protein